MVIDGVNYESAYKNVKAQTVETPQPSAGNSKPETQKNISSTKKQVTKMTAREIIYTLPDRFKSEKVEDHVLHVFHLKLDGETGGDFTVDVKNKNVIVQDGLVGEPTCVITAKATDYEDLELGRGNPQMMFMMGKIKVTNLGEVMKFVTYFQRLA